MAGTSAVDEGCTLPSPPLRGRDGEGDFLSLLHDIPHAIGAARKAPTPTLPRKGGGRRPASRQMPMMTPPSEPSPHPTTGVPSLWLPERA